VTKRQRDTQPSAVQLARDDLLPAAFDRELRLLRFKDPELERAFRTDYATRRLPQFRLVFWVGLAIQIPLSLRYAIGGEILPNDPRFWLRLAVGVIPAVVGLRLARSPRAVRWLPSYMVFYVLLIGAVLVAIFSTTAIGWTQLTIYLIAACIMSRLRALEAALVQFVLVGWYAVFTSALVDRPTDGLTRAVFSLATQALFILVANYLIEASGRRDFLLMRLLGEERDKSDRLLLNILPAPIVERLKESPGTVADSFADMTVLFADIADSTPNMARLSPEAAVELLNDVFTTFDRLAEKHGLEKIKTIGDAYMVVGGVPEARSDHAEAVFAMALDMQKATGTFTWPDGEPLEIRIGINTGPAVAGVIGTRKFAYDLWGDTVNVASRMEFHGTPGAIQMTGATRRRVGRRHRFTRRTINVKGKGPMSVYVLEATHGRVVKPRPKVKAAR
jgi:class 3 adenylate cyclase